MGKRKGKWLEEGRRRKGREEEEGQEEGKWGGGSGNWRKEVGGERKGGRRKGKKRRGLKEEGEEEVEGREGRKVRGKNSSHPCFPATYRQAIISMVKPSQNTVHFICCFN